MGRVHGSISRPPVLFKKRKTADVDPNPIFKPLNYVIVWFDAAYPHSLYSGYESQLQEVFPTYPFRMESSLVDTVRLLRTTMANCYYVLIVSGEKKKELLDLVFSSPAIVVGYITESHGLDAYGDKMHLCGNFKDMTKLIGEFLVPIKVRNSCLPPHKAVNLVLTPDPCVMSEQATRAIALERKEQDGQMMYHHLHCAASHLYLMAIALTLDHFAQQRARFEETGDVKYLENPLLEVLKVHAEKPEEQDPRQYFDCFMSLLELAQIFDQCPTTYCPQEDDGDVRDIVGQYVNLGNDLYKLFSKVQKFRTALDNCKGNLFAPEVRVQAAKLHKHLLHFVTAFIIAKGTESAMSEWTGFPLCWALLADVDFCLKLFIDSLFDYSTNFASFSEPISRSLLVSDYRIGVAKEIVARLTQGLGHAFRESPEYPCASDSVNVRIAILLGESGTVADVAKELLETVVRGHKFASAEDFCRSSDKSRFQHHTAYFVADQTFSQAEYGMLLSVCIQNSITPIMVVCLQKGTTKDEGKTVMKEMLRRPWTVTTFVTDRASVATEYMTKEELAIDQEMELFEESYKDFHATLARFGDEVGKAAEDEDTKEEEMESGWEMSEKTDPKVLSKLISELTLGQKTVGSLHFYVYSFFKDLKSPLVYWDNYCPLFGVCSKYINTMDVTFGKNLLKAYTMQTKPPFYKMLNDAFRGGNPEKIGKFRAFYVMLHDLVRKGVLAQYIGTVYRGTYFSAELLRSLKPGARFVATCFTSTSKSQKVAHAFAAKTGRNVLLEVELNSRACSNVDIHAENCSLYPEEQEVLLLPFSLFCVKRIFSDDRFTYITLGEEMPESSTDDIRSIEYYN